MLRYVAVGALVVAASTASADITYAGYTFHDDAFADRAEQTGPGFLDFNDATTLDEALTGFTPDSGLYNIGAGTLANDFALWFDDLAAVDGTGADVVLFDLRYSADAYEIAVISGGVESAFLAYPVAAGIATGELHDAGAAEAYAYEIDLAAYGLASAEGIRFRATTGAAGNIQGDPTMAGVLNGVPVPAPAGVMVLGVGLLRKRRQ